MGKDENIAREIFWDRPWRVARDLRVRIFRASFGIGLSRALFSIPLLQALALVVRYALSCKLPLKSAALTLISATKFDMTSTVALKMQYT